MRKCKSCQAPIENKVKKCPSCGKDQRNWIKRHKIISGILVLFIFLIFLDILGSTDNNNNSKTNSTQQEASQSSTKNPVKRNIVVSSMIVKKVAPNTYRYFFNVANNDTQSFKGSIWLQLLNGHDNPQFLILGGATKSFSDNPIGSGQNSVTYVDDSNPPQHDAGIDGATTFLYKVTVDDNEVASGKNSISDQYENDIQ